MIRLWRHGMKAQADWKAAVDAAFVDAEAFWKAAREFERLAAHGATRKLGFAAYAGHVLPLDGGGKPYFPAVWSEHAPTRQAIAGMSYGFCAYCQSAVSSNHPGKGGLEKPPGQIEHFLPKSRFPAQAYLWSNYFLCCGGCNNAKGNKWPVGGYVRPDRGKPERRFEFARDGKVSARRKRDRAAKKTIKDFDLNRDWLKRHRETAIKSHVQFVERLLGRVALKVEDVLVEERTAFSSAVNQNARRVWEEGMRKATR